jgi:uncharacterized integral membrane protein (TIGR00698 family)
MKTRALFILLALALVFWNEPPLALLAGLAFALLFEVPFAAQRAALTKLLLQTCVVLLGFGMDLPVVLRAGVNGSVFAAATIGTTLLLGWWLGRKLRLGAKTSVLISAGTAICGGSAIAAVSPVIAASEAEIAVSIGAVFLLNAVALYIFPLAGHWLHLSGPEFGLWAGVAIHDISSVVGAALSYGPDALATATAVKLSRTLWIVPLVLALAFWFGRKNSANPGQSAKVAVPWFIGLFLAASLLRSRVPVVTAWSPMIAEVARRGMTLVLFSIGTSLSVGALRKVGWRMVAAGLGLWVFISTVSLFAIRHWRLAA